MKHIVILVLAIISLLLYSYEKEILNHFGFNSAISKNSNSITIMHIEDGAAKVNLEQPLLFPKAK